MAAELVTVPGTQRSTGRGVCSSTYDSGTDAISNFQSQKSPNTFSWYHKITFLSK